MTFSVERIVEWGECDPAGIVFYPNYFRYIDAAFHELARKAGFDQTSLIRTYGLFGTPLVEAKLRFLGPARYGDKVTIAVSISRLGRTGLTLSYRLFAASRLIAEGHEARVFTKASDKGGQGLVPAPIPPAIRAALETYATGETAKRSDAPQATEA